MSAVAPAMSRAQTVLPDDPSLDQYIESVPGPDGRRAPDSTPDKSAKLPPGVRLGSNPDDRLLGRVVTSPQLGAPETPTGPAARRQDSANGSNGARDRNGARAPAGRISPPPRPTASVINAPGPTIPLLVCMLALILVALALPAVRRLRASRRA